MSELFKVSSNPHIRSKVTTNGIMLAVIVALLPATGFGIYNFGPRAIAVILVTIASTVLTEFFYGIYRKKLTITDLSAVVTGLLLALNLPVTIPLWMAALGGVFAILVVKMLFGGLGQNFMNPALAARCFLLISFPGAMAGKAFECDAYTGVHDSSGLLLQGTAVVPIPLLPNKRANVKPNYDEQSEFRSSGRDGFLCDYIAMPRDGFVPVYDDSVVYVFSELVSVVLNAFEAFEQSCITGCDSFGVWGDGSVGYVVCLILR